MVSDKFAPTHVWLFAGSEVAALPDLDIAEGVLGLAFHPRTNLLAVSPTTPECWRG